MQYHGDGRNDSCRFVNETACAWLKSPYQYIKINSDTSFVHGSGGAGVVAQDSQGRLLSAVAIPINGVLDPDHAEC